MTKEEFLIPRYISTQPDPYSQYCVGSIFTYDNKKSKLTQEAYCEAFDSLSYFLKLQWWEYRDFADLPEYVVWDPYRYTNHKPWHASDIVFRKVIKHITSGCIVIDDFQEGVHNLSYSLDYLYPATEEEYNDYVNKKYKKNNGS